MATSISPTTLGYALVPFRSITEGTYSSTLGAPIPTTGDECDRVLDAAEAMPMTWPLTLHLAGFLGAASRIWTSVRRAHLRDLIARAGLDGVNAALTAVARAPREEVIEEAANVLAAAASIDALLVMSLAERVRAGDPRSSTARADSVVAAHPAVRATIARAFGRIRGQQTRERRMIALARALGDPAVEVRDAAIQALASSQDPAGRRLLELRRPHEPEAFLVDEINAALAEFAGL